MRKLIEKQETGLVVCDNPNCDYELPHTTNELKLIQFINVACPKCGQNLLTENDYIQYVKISNLIDWINKWFSWITIFSSKKTESKGNTISVHVHDGVKVKQEDSPFASFNEA